MAKKTSKKKTTRKAVDKAAKFKELAQKRMTKAIKAIGQLTNLANRNNYEYTDAQVQSMLDALDAQLTVVQEAFAQPEKGASVGGFEFE